MIGYYVHHQGQGHRRRATAVAREMACPVVGLGTGDAPEGWPGEWVSLAADDEPAVPDEAMADVTAGGVLHWVPRGHAGLLERHRQVVEWLSRVRPALVVVDVSVEVALLVRLCGVPVVVGAMPGDRTDAVHALAYDVAEALLAPWPQGAHPDAGWPQAWYEKTWHVGGISTLAPAAASDREGVRSAHGASDASGAATPSDPEGVRCASDADAPADRPRRVLVVWGNGGDPLREVDVDAARAATPGWEWAVRGGGWPVAADLAQDLADADVVVCHAGQGSVADVAQLRRPAVVLAQPRPYDEQDATVRALTRMGLAVTAYGWPQDYRWPELLERALATGGERWGAWGGDGAARAAARLDSLAGRLGEDPAGGRGTSQAAAVTWTREDRSS